MQHVLQMQRLEAMEGNPVQSFRHRQLLGDRVHLIQQTKRAAGVPMVTFLHSVEPTHAIQASLGREYEDLKEEMSTNSQCATLTTWSSEMRLERSPSILKH